MKGLEGSFNEALAALTTEMGEFSRTLSSKESLASSFVLVNRMTARGTLASAGDHTAPLSLYF